MADDLSKVFADPGFRKLASTEKIKVLDAIDDGFAQLPPVEKAKVIQTGLGSFEEPSFLDKAMEFGGGVRAGALSTAAHSADLLRRAGQRMAGSTPIGSAFKQATSAIPSDLLNRPDVKWGITPTPGLGEKGFAAEQATEFMLPIPGAKYLKVAKAPGLLNLGLRTMVGAGREALDVGLKTAAQTGDVQQAKTGAGIGAGFGAAAPLIGAAAPAWRRGAERTYAEMLAPGTKADKFVTQNRLLNEQGKDLLERRVMALSESGLKTKVARNLAETTQKLEDEWTKLGPNHQHSVLPILDALNDGALREATEVVGPGQFASPGLPGRRIVDPELYAAYQNAALDVIERLGPIADDASAFSMRRVRQLLDTAVKESFAGKELTGAQRQAKRAETDAIRAVLNDQNPTLAKLNKEYSFWRTVDDVLEHTKLRRVGQRRAIKAATRIVFGAAGFAHGGAEGAGAGMYIANKFDDALTSTAWKSVSAVTKNEVAKLLASGKVEQAANLAARAAGRLNIQFTSPPEKGKTSQQPHASLPPPPGGEKVLAGWNPENRQLLAEASARQGVPLPLLYAVAANENAAGDPAARAGEHGGIGLMQVVQSTGDQWGGAGVDLTDPQQNINTSARLLRHLTDKFKRPELVLAAYRAGETAVQTAANNTARGGNVLNQLDPAVQQYVARGMRTLSQLSGTRTAAAAD